MKAPWINTTLQFKLFSIGLAHFSNILWTVPPVQEPQEFHRSSQLYCLFVKDSKTFQLRLKAQEFHQFIVQFSMIVTNYIVIVTRLDPCDKSRVKPNKKHFTTIKKKQ